MPITSKARRATRPMSSRSMLEGEVFLGLMSPLSLQLALFRASAPYTAIRVAISKTRRGRPTVV